MQNLNSNQLLLHNNLCSKLKELREAKGWSVYQLSKASGVPEIRIHAIEAGNTNFTTKYLVKLLDALGAALKIE
jgi:transcriptional regulator with XRE-family HTH domain